MARSTVGWGILGTGHMAKAFAADLRLAESAELVAVASRMQQKANAFGDKFHIPRRYKDYAQLVADPDVDVVYVATPNSMHKEHTLMALDAGKAVLCEKPFSTNAAEARTMISRARDRKRFLMEAMWTRFLPLMTKVRWILSEGALGEVSVLTADFGFRATGEGRTEILMSPAYGGGSLLDVGVYPVSLASTIFGPPSRLATLAHLGETGVDEQAGVVLGYPDGQLALLHSSIRVTTTQEATIIGTERRLRIHPPFWRSSRLSIFKEDDLEQTIEAPFEGDGYHFEATEVMNCLRNGQLESPLMPLDESLEIMNTMDHIRAQWGLRYPADENP